MEVTIRKAVNEMINHCHITSEHIYEMTVIGNSVMRDLFMGNPVESLGRSPFEPQNKHSVNVKAKDLKIKINPKSNIYALPLLSHFVGADTLAVILGTGIYKSSALSMAVDNRSSRRGANSSRGSGTLSIAPAGVSSINDPLTANTFNASCKEKTPDKQAAAYSPTLYPIMA